MREVAHRVGYRQPAQFAKAFRRYQGVAPSDFRATARPRRATRAPTADARGVAPPDAAGARPLGSAPSRPFA